MAQRVLVCEYVSGGGLGDTAGPAQAELLAQGLAMRDAMLADLAALPGVQVTCVQGPGLPAPADARGPAPDRAAGARRLLVPGPQELLLDVVRREAGRHDRVWVVAPETEGCLAALAEAVAPRQWIGCSPAAIRLSTSKRATLTHLRARGIATPLDFADTAARWVVKPDDGAGSVDTQVHCGHAAARADLEARAARAEAAALEPWVEGEALSLSLLVARSGHEAVAELLSVNRQRIAVAEGGRLAYEGVEILAVGAGDARHAALRACAHAVAEAVPGLRGFVGIDLVWHASRGPVVIEINPRLTCAYAGLSAALGRNLAGELLALHETADAAA